MYLSYFGFMWKCPTTTYSSYSTICPPPPFGEIFYVKLKSLKGGQQASEIGILHVHFLPLDVFYELFTSSELMPGWWLAAGLLPTSYFTCRGVLSLPVSKHPFFTKLEKKNLLKFWSSQCRIRSYSGEDSFWGCYLPSQYYRAHNNLHGVFS